MSKFSFNGLIDRFGPLLPGWWFSMVRYRHFFRFFSLPEALHSYVNKIIRDTVPQKNLLGNVEITVIRVFFLYLSQVYSHRLMTDRFWLETNAILKYMRTIYRCHACRYKPETNRNIAIFPSKIHWNSVCLLRSEYSFSTHRWRFITT
jgi:hypothetical protein